MFVAKAEIARRNISPDELVRTSVRVRELQRVNDSRPSMPLSAAGKIACFTFAGLFLFTLGSAVLLRTIGYRRKSNDAFKWTAIGMCFWISLGFIISAMA